MADVKVIFNEQGRCRGGISFASWQNDDLQRALQAVFHPTIHERIVAFHVRRDGITAEFEFVKERQ